MEEAYRVPTVSLRARGRLYQGILALALTPAWAYSLTAFFIFFFFPCNRADSMATGRVFNESNPHDCLISCGQACF